MAIDNSPRIRQRNKLDRKIATRANHKRVLIVTEGHTERNYFEEIKRTYKLSAVVIKRSSGTSPLNVVEYANNLFSKGDGGLYRKGDFDEVYAVFDRDIHASYFDALSLAEQLGNKQKMSKKHPVVFEAIPSNPCFELWLLIHFQDVSTLMHRHDVFTRVQAKLPGYEKGDEGIYSRTSDKLDDAIRRAHAMNDSSSPYSQDKPYTGIVVLVENLQSLKNT